MKKLTNITVHPNVIAKEIVKMVGLPETTKQFNAYRAQLGLASVKSSTVKRYLGAGAGYEKTSPRVFAEFCMSRVSLK